eukprot:335344-Amphidinium_carterae.1
MFSKQLRSKVSSAVGWFAYSTDAKLPSTSEADSPPPSPPRHISHVCVLTSHRGPKACKDDVFCGVEAIGQEGKHVGRHRQEKGANGEVRSL